MIPIFLVYRYKTKNLHQKGAIFEIAKIYTGRPYGWDILSVDEATTVALINSSRGKQGNPPPSERNLLYGILTVSIRIIQLLCILDVRICLVPVSAGIKYIRTHPHHNTGDLNNILAKIPIHNSLIREIS